MDRGSALKNKHIHDLVKQLHFDVRTSEDNIKSLANDLLRVERQFNELWQYVYKHREELAQKPELQTIRCDVCGNYSKDYQLRTDDGYLVEVICKTCLLEEENEEKQND